MIVITSYVEPLNMPNFTIKCVKRSMDDAPLTGCECEGKVEHTVWT